MVSLVMGTTTPTRWQTRDCPQGRGRRPRDLPYHRTHQGLPCLWRRHHVPRRTLPAPLVVPAHPVPGLGAAAAEWGCAWARTEAATSTTPTSCHSGHRAAAAAAGAEGHRQSVAAAGGVGVPLLAPTSPAQALQRLPWASKSALQAAPPPLPSHQQGSDQRRRARRLAVATAAPPIVATARAAEAIVVAPCLHVQAVATWRHQVVRSDKATSPVLQQPTPLLPAPWLQRWGHAAPTEVQRAR